MSDVNTAALIKHISCESLCHLMPKIQLLYERKIRMQIKIQIRMNFESIKYYHKQIMLSKLQIIIKRITEVFKYSIIVISQKEVLFYMEYL